MNVIRWSPRSGAAPRDLVSFQDEVNRLFDGFMGTMQRSPEEGMMVPPVDVEETPEEFIVRADLPGVSQKDVKVSLMGDTLTIRGTRTEQKEKKNGSYHRLERRSGTFERSFTFGTPVKNEGVRAQVRDGVLEVHVPKADEAKIREIEVQVAS